MAKYRNAKLKILRRLGDLPGFTNKKPTSLKRDNQHRAIQKKATQYGTRLEEKQKLRFNYGVTQKQLIKYVKQAKQSQGVTGNILLELLEMRLDNLIFRSGLAPTIPAARQIIGHKHVTVNQNGVSIPSFQCRVGDTLAIKDKANSKSLIQQFLKSPIITNIPEHLNVNQNELTAKIVSVINRKSVGLKLNELLVIEFYSRKV